MAANIANVAFCTQINHILNIRTFINFVRDTFYCLQRAEAGPEGSDSDFKVIFRQKIDSFYILLARFLSGFYEIFLAFLIVCLNFHFLPEK